MQKTEHKIKGLPVYHNYSSDTWQGNIRMIADKIDEILGLSESEGKETTTNWPPKVDITPGYNGVTVEDSKVKWCEHMMDRKEFSLPTYSNWKFCPICGAERPITKSLREELSIKLLNCYWVRDETLSFNPTEREKKVFLELSDLAIETIKQFEKGEEVKR